MKNNTHISNCKNRRKKSSMKTMEIYTINRIGYIDSGLRLQYGRVQEVSRELKFHPQTLAPHTHACVKVRQYYEIII